eukprot:694148-Prymnesium_polylepis.1
MESFNADVLCVVYSRQPSATGLASMAGVCQSWRTALCAEMADLQDALRSCPRLGSILARATSTQLAALRSYRSLALEQQRVDIRSIEPFSLRADLNEEDPEHGDGVKSLAEHGDGVKSLATTLLTLEVVFDGQLRACLLYTSDAADDM